MDGNINKNSFDNQEAGTKFLNHNKPFQDRAMKRFKNRNVPMNDNLDFRNDRNSKNKRSYKSYDEHTIVDSDMIRGNHIRADYKIESFPYKCFNGEKSSRSTTYNGNRKSSLNSTLNDYSKVVNNDTKRINRRKDLSEITTDRYIQRDHKANGIQCQLKETEFSRPVKTSVKMKFNFLQESQLVCDNSEAASDNSKDTSVAASSSMSSLKTTPSNGLNPAALEFTPNNSISLSEPPKNQSQQQELFTTDALENEFKSLSFGSDNCTQTISNPVVIDSAELSYPTNPQLALYCDQNQGSKMGGFIDQSLVHNMYQTPRARQLSGLSYSQTQQLMAQYQLATLYGANQQPLIRYNPAQSVPINFPGGYVLYNPIMFNGNQCNANRLVPLASADITNGGHLTTNIAHHFNSYPSYYTTDAMNNGISHIR